MALPKLAYQFDQLTAVGDEKLRKILQEFWQEIATKFNQLELPMQQQIINSVATVTPPDIPPSTCGLGLVATIETTSLAPGDYTLAHGLGYSPSIVIPAITNDGLIRFQTTLWDETNIYLNASDTGITATLFLLAPCECDGGTPIITSISPDNATAGSGAFTLTVNGLNFRSDSKVSWGGAVRPTTFVSSIQLTASIAAANVATEGTASVTVNNPGTGCAESNAVVFTIGEQLHGSIIAGGFYSGGVAASTFLRPYQGSQVSSNEETPFCVGGTARNLMLRLSSNLGGGQSVAFQSYLNNVMQTLGIPASLGAVAGNYTDLVNDFAVVAGDHFRGKGLGVGAPTGVAGWAFEYIDDDNSALCGAGASADGQSLGAGLTDYWGPCGAIYNGVEFVVLWPTPVTGTVRKFILRTSTAQPGDAPLTLTLRKGTSAGTMASEALEIVVPAGGAAGNYSDFNLGHGFAITEGVNLLSIQRVNSSGSTSAKVVGCMFEIVTSDGSVILGGSGDLATPVGAFATNVMGVFGSSIPSPTSAALLDMASPRDGIISKLYYYRPVLLGGGVAQTLTTILNGVAQTQSVSMASLVPVGIYGDTTHPVTVVQGDLIRVHYVNNAAFSVGEVGNWSMKFEQP